MALRWLLRPRWRVLARFHHRSIVAVYDIFEENSTAYMVMEFLKGETLAGRLDRLGQPFGEQDLLAIAAPLCEALSVIHAADVLHRDIKPGNVVLANGTGSVRPVLIDFGSAREFARGKAMRQTVVITPGYAPLEQYAEQAQRGPFTDMYALAATLYHVATGVQPPAATDRASGILLKEPRTLNPRLSEAFDRALLHGLEMQVDRRPQSAQEFFGELTGARNAPRTTTTSGTGTRTTTGPAGVHMARVHQIASEVAAGGVVQTDRLVCPVCRGATVIDPAKATGDVRCPICRAAGLQVRVSSDTRNRCPSCRKGTLEPVWMGAVMRCPACRIGYVQRYVKRRKLFVLADIWEKCDKCGADFALHVQKDTLTLVGLPNGPVFLNPQSQGQTLPRAEWMRLSRRTEKTFHCATCDSEFDEHPDGTLEWVADGGNVERVPVEHRGKRRRRIEWAKIGCGVRLEDGTHGCPRCDAQFDGTQREHEFAPVFFDERIVRGAQFDNTQREQLQLIRAPQDPHGVARSYLGQPYPIAIWRRLAAGIRDPFSPGLICPACTAEFSEAMGDRYTLAAYDTGHDAHGNGARYYRQQLTRQDWQRIAAARLPVEKGTRLIEEAHREFWAAVVAGEVQDLQTARNYPVPKAGQETVALELLTTQIKITQKGAYPYDSGTLWVTTKKVLYQGSRGNITITYDKISGCSVQRFGSTGLVVIERRDRAKPIYFFGGATGSNSAEVNGLHLFGVALTDPKPMTGFIRADVSGLQLQLSLNADRLVEFIQAQVRGV